MPTSRLTINGTIGGVSLNSTLSKTSAGQIGHDTTLFAATAGSLTTRTDDDEGVIAAAGHGLITGDVIDVYWSGGRRYNVPVVIAGDDVQISGGVGDVLPDQDTAVTIAVQQEIDTDFDGDLVTAIGTICVQRGHVSFYNGAALQLAIDLDPQVMWYWWKDDTATNPLAAKTVTHIVATQAEASADANFKLGILYDSAG